MRQHRADCQHEWLIAIPQQGEYFPRQVGHRKEINFHHLSGTFRWCFQKRTDGPRAGVVDQAIQAPPMLADPFLPSLAICRLRHIARENRQLAVSIQPDRIGFLPELCESFLAASGGEDQGALLCETQGERSADAAAGSCHQDPLSIQASPCHC
jgi:hypothetical protein